MKTKTYKVAELSGPLLDLAVAMAEGRTVQPVPRKEDEPFPNDAVFIECGERHTFIWVSDNRGGASLFYPSTNPAQGQPIAERGKISVEWDGDQWWTFAQKQIAEDDFIESTEGGETMLIAICRSFVYLNFGNTIEQPEGE